MMEKKALLDGTMPPNTWKVKNTGKFNVRFSKEYPEMLRGIMQEGEFSDYLGRINEALYVPVWRFLLIFLPFILFIPIPILFTLLDSPIAGGIYMGCLVVFCIVIELASLITLMMRGKAADVRVNEIIGEINQRFYSRGAHWAYSRGTKYVPSCIDITFFNPSTAPQSAAPSTWGQTPYSSIGAPAQSASMPICYSPFSSSYSPYTPYTPSAPPPPQGIVGSADLPPAPPSYPGDPSVGYY